MYTTTKTLILSDLFPYRNLLCPTLQAQTFEICKRYVVFKMLKNNKKNC